MHNANDCCKCYCWDFGMIYYALFSVVVGKINVYRMSLAILKTSKSND